MILVSRNRSHISWLQADLIVSSTPAGLHAKIHWYYLVQDLMNNGGFFHCLCPLMKHHDIKKIPTKNLHYEAPKALTLTHQNFDIDSPILSWLRLRKKITHVEIFFYKASTVVRLVIAILKVWSALRVVTYTCRLVRWLQIQLIINERMNHAEDLIRFLHPSFIDSSLSYLIMWWLMRETGDFPFNFRSFNWFYINLFF